MNGLHRAVSSAWQLQRNSRRTISGVWRSTNQYHETTNTCRLRLRRTCIGVLKGGTTVSSLSESASAPTAEEFAKMAKFSRRPDI